MVWALYGAVVGAVIVGDIEVIGLFPHVPKQGGGGGVGVVPNVISDDADCPGRGRMAGEGAIGRVREDEVSGGAACPGRGRMARHPEFKGDDKSSNTVECPGKGRVVGREVGFGTCEKGLDDIQGLDVVTGTGLNVVSKTKLDMAFAELDSLRSIKSMGFVVLVLVLVSSGFYRPAQGG